MPAAALAFFQCAMIRAGRLEYAPRDGLHISNPAQERGLFLAGVVNTDGITAGVTGRVEMILADIDPDLRGLWFGRGGRGRTLDIRSRPKEKKKRSYF
ncbi:MAG: hypothetical protein ABF812_14260 [Gluconobacter cerinus]|uniref:hypothetical protein n=1 Tax=Acetobacteraceae TaxID=433 RepID=UPI000E571FFF|nr:hypothetical protein [Komagataeibacter saccharivorans]